jgi:hypothetical protein
MNKYSQKKYAMLIPLLFLVFNFAQGVPRVKAVQDNTPPQITAFSIAPTEFNTNSSTQTLTLTVTLTDDLAGVCIAGDCGEFNSSPTQVRLKSTSGDQFANFVIFSRTSGDDKNGDYTSSIAIPAGSAKGEWTVDMVLLVDKLGNLSSLTSGQLLSVIPGADTSFINTATVEDITPPQITAFSIMPTEFNTESEDQTLTLTMTLTDNLSGLCIAGDCGNRNSYSVPSVRLKSPSGTQFSDSQDLIRISGNDKNGSYTAHFNIPKGSAKGIWTVDSVLLVDKLNNYKSLSRSQLLGAVPSANTSFTNIATVEDITPPQITAFSITPTEFNTESEDQTLTLTMTLTDDYTGVCISGDCGDFNSSPTQVRLIPLIGTQSRVFYDFSRTSGDDKNGVYAADLTIPAHSKEGIWTVDYVALTDKLGNRQTLSISQLLVAVPSAAGVTVANTASASSITIERDWTISSDTASVSFSSGTVVTKKEGGSFAFYQMANQSSDLEQLLDVDGKPAVGLVDQYGNPLVDEYGEPIYDEINALTAATVRIGIPGLNLSFSNLADISLIVDPKYNGYRLNISSLAEDEDSWAQETSCLVRRGKCNFSADHATYFTALAGSGFTPPKAKTPTVSPKAKTYKTPQTVTLATGTSGAAIYYTLDGSDPTTSSDLYSDPITISANTNIKAIAVKSGMRTSDIMDKNFKFTVEDPVFSLKSGTYYDDQTVSIATATEGASIYYTTDGSIPTAGATLYAGPIEISASQNISAIAYKEGWNAGKVKTKKYTLKAIKPTASPVGGTYSFAQSVTLSTTTGGAVIHYTTDGSEPTVASSAYSSPITVSTSQTIRAIAVKAGWNNSKTLKAKYKINLLLPI